MGAGFRGEGVRRVAELQQKCCSVLPRCTLKTHIPPPAPPPPPAYPQALYNREELPLTALCGNDNCELQRFEEHVLGPLLLTRAQHQEECRLHFLHDAPAGEHTETARAPAVSVSSAGAGAADEEVQQEVQQQREGDAA